MFDSDHNGVPDSTTDYRYGVPVSERFHPNGGPVEREVVYVDGAVREIYSVGPDGSRTLIRSHDQVGRELSTQK